MPENNFDVLVIGGGPGGYVAAIRGAQLGLNVACVEADKLGGVCLNTGCIPTKALLTSAALVTEIKTAGEHGITFSKANVDLGPAQERSRAIAEQLAKGVGHLFKKNKVIHVEGRGRLLGGGGVEVEAADGSREKYLAGHVILATGSRPRDIGVLPIDEDRIWSSTGALFRIEAPDTLAVVGAGAVGMEFADIYSAYGTQVTVLEALDRILPLEDADSSAAVERSFKKRGVNIHTGAVVEGADVAKQSVKLKFTDRKGERRTLKVQHVLSAVGRVPNTEDLGLEAAGVQLDDQGFFVVDEYMRTSVTDVYAIGDCAGRQLLAHKAMHEGVVCVEAIRQSGAWRGGLSKRSKLHVLQSRGRIGRTYGGAGQGAGVRDRCREVSLGGQRSRTDRRPHRGLCKGHSRRPVLRDPRGPHRRTSRHRADRGVRSGSPSRIHRRRDGPGHAPASHPVGGHCRECVIGPGAADSPLGAQAGQGALTRPQAAVSSTAMSVKACAKAATAPTSRSRLSRLFRAFMADPPGWDQNSQSMRPYESSVTPGGGVSGNATTASTMPRAARSGWFMSTWRSSWFVRKPVSRITAIVMGWRACSYRRKLNA